MGIVLSKKKLLEVIARKGILPVFKFISKKLEDKNLQIQVNLCQKLLFLHQLTHNMTTDCALNYQFSTLKFQAQNMSRTYQEHGVYKNCSECQKQFLYSICSPQI